MDEGRRPLLFLSMPITPRNKPDHPVIEFLENIKLGADVAVELLNMGACVYCPGNDFIYWLATDGPEDTVIYNSDLDVISYCVGMVTVPGWEKSPNCRKEVDAAKRRTIIVYDWPEERDDIETYIKWYRRTYR